MIDNPLLRLQPLSLSRSFKDAHLDLILIVRVVVLSVSEPIEPEVFQDLVILLHIGKFREFNEVLSHDIVLLVYLFQVLEAEIVYIEAYGASPEAEAVHNFFVKFVVEGSCVGKSDEEAEAEES
jgi:hypothetical protein